MILTCPECATRYFVDDAKLGAEGRTVRCASCSHSWRATPEPTLELVATPEEGAVAKDIPETAPAAPAAVEPLPKVFRAKAVEKKSMRRAAVHGAVWAGMLAAFAALFGAAALFRVDIVRFLPRTASAYAMVGMPVNPTGLVFEHISAKPSLQDGHSALVVSGQVRNIEDRDVTAPKIRIHVLDAHGKTVAQTLTTAAEPHLKPGETRHFVVSIVDPPATAQDVEVAFLLEPKAKAHGEKAHANAPHPEPGHAPALRGHAEPAAHAAPAPPPLRGADHGQAVDHHQEPVPTPAKAPHSEAHHAPGAEHH